MERRRIYETWPAETALEPPGEDTARLYLDAHIRPHRSLANPGFIILMAAVAAISFTAGISFMVLGAWPVLGFFGLDVLLVWLAFKLSYRDGRRLEIVRINERNIEVSRRWPTGHTRLYRMPAAWARVEVDGEGEPDVQTRLTAMGKHLIIGSMLSPREREALAEAVREALMSARRGVLPEKAQEPGGAA